MAAGILFTAIVALPIQDEVLPPAARFTAAVAILMVTLWVTEAIPLEATALIPLIFFPLLGILTVQQSAEPYADQVIFLFLGGFIIARAMERWNLHHRIALNIIRIAGGFFHRLFQLADVGHPAGLPAYPRGMALLNEAGIPWYTVCHP
ncbi:MAG: anion permease [Methanoregula sp.]|nr:anion permease [Methanoregula sp.]